METAGWLVFCWLNYPDRMNPGWALVALWGGALHNMDGLRPDRKMTKPTYFVAATKVFELVADPSLWVKSGATTLDGAKRSALKKARGTTFTARVATENANGEIQTISELHNSSAITRRRPKWRVCVG